jgi:hypothetical protein
MRSDIVQAVAISMYGNAFLKGYFGDRAPELHGYSTAFRAVHDVSFVRNLDGILATLNGPVGDGTAHWYKKLKSEGVERFAVHLAFDNFDDARHNSSPWGVLSDREHILELWQPVWKARVGRFHDDRVWRVDYHSSRMNRWSVHRVRDLDETERELQSSIAQTIKQVRLFEAESLGFQFQRSLELHLQRDQQIVGFGDLVPACASSETHVLCATATRLMLILSTSQWSDFMESQPGIGRSISSQLWQVVCQSLECACNLPMTSATTETMLTNPFGQQPTPEDEAPESPRAPRSA